MNQSLLKTRFAVAALALVFAPVFSGCNQPTSGYDDAGGNVGIYPPDPVTPPGQPPEIIADPPLGPVNFPSTPRSPRICGGCYGSGQCRVCNGDGDASEWSYSYGPKPCSTCNATGRCSICGGVGTR